MAKLWVDDERMPPDNTWEMARSFHEAVHMLNCFIYDTVSLDHDLASFYGHKEMTGYDIVCWMEDQTRKDPWHMPRTILIHSANPVGRKNMQAGIDQIEALYKAAGRI